MSPALDISTTLFIEAPVTHTSPVGSMAIDFGCNNPPPLIPLALDKAPPVLDNSETELFTEFANQALPDPSIATPSGPLIPPPENESSTVQSFGAALSPPPTGGVPPASAYSALTFAPGWCAMLIAAVAVSLGFAPVALPSDVASANSVAHCAPPLAQLARMSASVLISVCGTVPFPAGVVASAAPVLSVSRFVAFRNAFAIPTFASAVPELDTCVA